MKLGTPTQLLGFLNLKKQLDRPIRSPSPCVQVGLSVKVPTFPTSGLGFVKQSASPPHLSDLYWGRHVTLSGHVKSSWRDSYALVDGEKMERVADFIFLGSKVTVDSDCSHEIKGHLLLGRKAMTNVDYVLKSREITSLKKGPYSQSYGFSSSNVLMWELDHKEGWVPENWWSRTVVLEKILESPLERKEIKPRQS